ncbi:MAG: anti sigma factor C-terminal domain-containing protein [Tissierellaceae bacterium]
MNYKDLLDRYKKGKVTEEEKQLIEQELEKQEAFEEYMAETFDEEISHISGLSSDEICDEETRKIKKSVNSKLRRVVVKSVLIMTLLYLSIFYGVSNIINSIYYNPKSVTMSEKEEYKRSDFFYDMQAYLSLNKPGFSLGSWASPEAKGFGKYEIMYSMKDLFAKDETMHFMNLSKGRLSYGIDGIFGSKSYWLFEGFKKIKYELPENKSGSNIGWDREIESKNKETIRYLKELNPLSYISVSIVFKEDLTMEEFYYMSNEEYPSINFKWVGIRTIKPSSQIQEPDITPEAIDLIGFNPNTNDEGSHTQRPNLKKYPLFYLSDWRTDAALSDLRDKDYPEVMAEAYEIHFTSRLQYLRDREKFVKLFDYKTEFYDDALTYISENGVKTYGALAYGTAEEFLKYIYEIQYDTIFINQVLPTKPNIYSN